MNIFAPPIPASVNTYDSLIDYASKEGFSTEGFSKVLEIMSRAYYIGKLEASTEAKKQVLDVIDFIDIRKNSSEEQIMKSSPDLQ